MLNSTEKQRPKIVNALIETFGISPWFASIVALFLAFLAAAALVWIWLSAPPRAGNVQLYHFTPADAYRPLLRLEREVQTPITAEQAAELRARLDEIEEVPASFAYQFHALRGHVAFVRTRLKAAVAAA